MAKFIGFIVTRSSSLFAETLHSLGDSCNQILLLFGEKRARRKPSNTHQFGYGKERYFYSFIVALTIFFLGGVFSIREALVKIAGEESDINKNYFVAIIIIGVSLIAEGFSFRTALKESNAERKGLSWGTYIKRSKSPELPVVLLEDLAALVGLVLAFLGVGLTYITKNHTYDNVATLLIGLLLISVSMILGIEMKSLLLGESVVKEEEKEITSIIEGSKDVEKIIHLKTLHLSPDEILLGVKIGVNKNITMTRLDKLIDEIEKKIRKKNQKIKIIYIEPAIYKKLKK